MNIDRATFLMGKTYSHTIGPAANGNSISTTVTLIEVRERAGLELHHSYNRCFTSGSIAKEMKKALQEMGTLKRLKIILETEYDAK